VLRLRFSCGALTDWSQIDPSRLPLYLNADAPLASALHQALTLNTQAMYVRWAGHTERQPVTAHFAPKGFAEEDRLWPKGDSRSEEHTSELQSRSDLVCRLLLEKKK